MNGEAEAAEQKDWSELEPTYSVKVFLTVLYSLILVIGIVGNSVTIRVTQVLQHNGYLQKNVTDHMVSLACSDLLVLLIGMPVELYSAIWYPFMSASGDVYCKVYNFLFEACSYATILNVATLSFERYMAICHPFRFKALTGRLTSSLIAFAWLISVAVALPLLVATGTEGHIPVREDKPVQNLTFCTNLRQRWVMYRVSISLAFVVYMVVLVSVALMCRAMILVLRKPLGSTAGGLSGSEAASKHESSRVKTARKQTIIFLGLIVGALMVCWLPNQIRRLMTAAVPKSDWTMTFYRSYVKLHPVADTFFYLSSVLNPFLYNLSSKQFREVSAQVLCCRLQIKHINKRTVMSAAAASTRSRKPLMSLHRDRSSRDGAKKNPVTFTTFQGNCDSGVGSSVQETLTLSETSNNVPPETEI